MAKKDTATEQQQTGLAMAGGNGNGGTSLATAGASGLVTRDELAGVLDDAADLTTDGLEEVGAEDYKVAQKVFNFKGTDKAGDPIAPNVFFDTLEESTKKELILAPLTITKGNEWRDFDNATQKTVVHCRSFDREIGTMADGTERYCQGCPDAQWQTDPNTGKRSRHCGPVYNLFALEKDTATPCIIRFRRTSLPVIQNYLSKHIIARRVVNGKAANYPLFSFEMRASLKMEKGSGAAAYAVPVLERGPVHTREQHLSYADSARAYRDIVLPHLRKIVERDDRIEGAAAAAGEGDSSFDTSSFVDAKGSGSGSSAGVNDGLR